MKLLSIHSPRLWVVTILLFGSYFFVDAVFDVYYELEERYQEMVKRLPPPSDTTTAYEGLAESWICPQTEKKSFKVEELMGQLKEMLENGRFMQFRDACLKCSKLTTSRGQANPIASKAVTLSETKVDSLVDILRGVIERLMGSLKTPHRLTYEILQAYLMLHPKVYEVPARLVVALLRDFKPEPSAQSGSDLEEESPENILEKAYPILRSFLREPLYRSNVGQWRNWYEETFPFPEAKEIVDFYILRARTITFLSTAHKAESISGRTFDFESISCPIDKTFTIRDRQNFLRYLINEEDFPSENAGYRVLVLQNYLQVSTEREVVASTPPSTTTTSGPKAPVRAVVKKNQFHPTVKDPARLLLLESTDRFPEQFEAFLSVIGDPLFEPTDTLLQFALTPPSPATGRPPLVCHFLMKNEEGSPSEMEAIANLSKLLLTLTFMRNLAHAQRIYKQTVTGCRLFAKGPQEVIVQEALKFPERAEPVRFLLGRSFFNPERIALAWEADALLSVINNDKLEAGPATAQIRALFQPDQSTYGDYEVTRKESGGTVVTTREPKAAIHYLFRAPLRIGELSEFLDVILTNYLTKLAELKAKDTKTVANGPKWEARANEIFKTLLQETPLKDVLPNTDYFYDWLGEILRREAYGPFKGLCSGPQCAALPMKMITRFWEEALVLIDKRETAATPTDRALVNKELIGLQEAYLLRMGNLTKMLRRLYVVTYKDAPGMAPPGLLDRKALADNFASMNYGQALGYLKPPDMWPMRQALIAWYGKTLLEHASEQTEVMSHLVMGAIHEHRLHTLKELLRVENLSPAFRHTEGARFYLLYLLYQLALANRGDTLPKELKSIPLLHVRLMLSVNGELTDLQKGYDAMLSKMEEAAKGGGDEKPQSPEEWEVLQEKHRSGLYEPTAPPPAQPPLQGPVEAILNDFCLGPPGQAPWCPFVKRDQSTPLFTLDAYVSQTRVNEPTLGRPPHDGYVEEFVLWLVRLCRDEMTYRRASKVKVPDSGTRQGGAGVPSRGQGALGGGGRGGSDVAATTENIPADFQLPAFFEIIINEASHYLMINPEEDALKPIWLYASQVLRPETR